MYARLRLQNMILNQLKCNILNRFSLVLLNLTPYGIVIVRERRKKLLIEIPF